jgi:hypothetical protein
MRMSNSLRSVPDGVNNRAFFGPSMIPHMIPLTSKYSQVLPVIIPIVSVLMVDNVLRLQSKVSRDNGPSKTLTRPVRSIAALRLHALYIGVVTFLVAKYMTVISHISPAFRYWLTTQGTRYRELAISCFGGVYASLFKCFIHALPGYIVAFGNADNGLKVNSISVDDVNYVLGRELHGVTSLFRWLIDEISLHYQRLVVKVKGNISYIIGCMYDRFSV